MSICDSEENRKKLAWLVPSYILLAWFFCVLFQPLGIHSPSSSASRTSLYANDKNYEVLYLMDEEDEDSGESLCHGNGTVVTLEKGSRSAVIVRLGHHHYQYRPFNCSIQVRAGASLDGLTAVVEEMDLREDHEDADAVDARQPSSAQPGGGSGSGHGGRGSCVDYVEAYTDKSKVRNKLCGKWNVFNDDRLNSHGPRQTLVGYCYDDRSGHSCESASISINAVVGAANQQESKYGLNLRRRQGFSIVVTGYRHLDVPSAESDCAKDEFSCPIHDFSLHDQRPHCIWDRLKCDSHQNCGFTFNKDEDDCLFSGINAWSVSTMTLLIVIYLAIVLILVLVTMLLLRWHRALRASPSSSSSDPLNDMVTSANMVTTDLPDGSSTTEARTGTVSIIVSYRPHFKPKTNECPPSYESLYLGEHPPPTYHAVTVEEEEEVIVPPAAAAAAVVEVVEAAAGPLGAEQHGEEEEALAFRGDHCNCDCDHNVVK